ncbi:unnamed protein product, partial [Rotaria magnacalcarata]
DIVVGAVDATAEPDLAAKFSVQGFPTFKYFENGQLSSDYSGERTEKDFSAFLIGPTDKVEL